MTNNILVLGVGNTLRRDDGIGPVVIDLLSKEKKPGVDYLDGGIDGLALLDMIKPYQRAIIVDAVNMNVAPGTIKLFSPDDAKINIKNDALSTHGFGLAEVIAFVEKLDIKTELQIVGIQPLDISFGEGLTDVVKTKINDVIDLVGTLI
jgi:hydrogenase maturation protease